MSERARAVALGLFQFVSAERVDRFKFVSLDVALGSVNIDATAVNDDPTAAGVPTDVTVTDVALEESTPVVATVPERELVTA